MRHLVRSQILRYLKVKLLLVLDGDSASHIPSRFAGDVYPDLLYCKVDWDRQVGESSDD
jgi:hypothetical protein